jgi:hypothetical protein
MKQDFDYISNGTRGGIFASIIGNITFENLGDTAILAAEAAAVSYLISWIIKKCIKRWQKQKAE